MAQGTKEIVVCWIFLVMTSTTGMCQSVARDGRGHNDMSLSEKALHHYSQLINVLTEIKKNGLKELPAILSTSGSTNSLKSDLSSLVLNSLLSSCFSIQNSGTGSNTNINIFNNSSVNFVMKTKSNKGDAAESRKRKLDVSTKPGPNAGETLQFSDIRFLPKSSEETFPVRPLNFTLNKEQDMVRIKFEVLRTKSARASRTWTFDGEHKFLKGPEDYGLDAGTPIASVIDFVFNASQCPPDLTSSGSPKRERFSFTEANDDANEIQVILPTCFLDVISGRIKNNNGYDSDTMDGENVTVAGGIPKDKLNIYSEYSQTLQFSDSWQTLNFSTIRKSPGENVTLDVGIYMKTQDRTHMYGLFYNAGNDSMVLSNSWVLSSRDGELDTQEFDERDQVSLLRLDILNQTNINGTIPGTNATASGDNGNYLYVSFRLTVLTADEDLTGLLHFQHDHQLPLDISTDLTSSSPISLTHKKRIKIVSANQKDPFPMNKFHTHLKRRFMCGSRSFSYHAGFGKNCTFFCIVSGTDLKHIRVRKMKGGVDPVQKYAEVFPNHAYIFANLGPTNKEQDGEYECRANTYGGKKHKWRIAVRTWGFPKVIDHQLEVSNDSSTFTCTGASDPMRPVEISVYLLEDYRSGVRVRIDNNPNVTRSIVQNGNETSMNLTMPTSFLKWPQESIVCQVKNDAGEVMGMESLSSFKVPSYYFQTDHPFIMKENSGVKSDDYYNTTFTCTATGKHPMTIDFYIDEFSENGRIKNNSMNQIFQKQVDDELTAMLILPTASVRWPHHYLYCQAKNSAGNDILGYLLFDVVENFYGH